MDTTRKISEQDIRLLDEFQVHLKRRGISVSQKKLIDESIHFALEHEQELLLRLGKKKDNTREMTEKFLKHAKKFDFGKKWMEEIDISL